MKNPTRKGSVFRSFRCLSSSLNSISPSLVDTTSVTNTDDVSGRFGAVDLAASARRRAAFAAELATADFRAALPATLVAEIAEEGRPCVAPFAWKEILLGTKLGEGEFAAVYEVHSFRLCDSCELDDGEAAQRREMGRCERYPRTGEARYAVKVVKPEHADAAFVQAARDLALEVEFLSVLSHPNIIQLRGTVHSGPTGIALVMDRLVETLDQRLARRRLQSRGGRFPSGLAGLRRSLSAGSTGSARADDAVEMERNLALAEPIAAALAYLHSHRVMFRDCKPQNIGFDVRGDVRLFDFGLARILSEDGGDEAYKMSGAGSPRYMAPECLSRNPYNLKADVYSFAIILWEILSGQIPYAFARRKHHLVTYVVEENGRPDIDEAWPSAIQELIEQCFSAGINTRPEMKEVHGTIRDALISLQEGGGSKHAKQPVRKQSLTADAGGSAPTRCSGCDLH